VKVLYVTSRFPFGPGEAFLTPEVRALGRLGVELRIVPTHGSGTIVHPDAGDLEECTITAHLVDRSVLHSTTRPVGVRDLIRGVACVRHDLRLRQLSRNLAILPKAAWLAEQVRRWQPDHIHAHWAATSSTMAMVVSLATGVPWSFTAHRWDIYDRNLLKEKVRRASFARFISQGGLAAAHRLTGAVRGTKAIVLPMGVDVPLEYPRRIPPIDDPTEPIRVLCPASLVPVKGHRYLLDALALLHQRGRSLRLLCAGDGPLRSALQAHAQTLGVAHSCDFLGTLPHDALLRLMRDPRIGAVVLPSLDLGAGLHEGVPVSLMEAMAAGIPVIATHTGAIPELVEGFGMLVQPERAGPLATAIEHLLYDAVAWQEHAHRAWKRVSGTFSADRVANLLLHHIRNDA
jgi:glycosyltransferase involved in cell wall biosynthesis